METKRATPMQAANQNLKSAFVEMTKAIYVWFATIWENTHQKKLEGVMFKREPAMKNLVQLMQQDAEMRILVDMYTDRLQDESTEPVYLDQEHKMQILSFCEKNRIKPNPRIFCHAWEKIPLVLDDQGIEDDGFFNLKVGNVTIFFWRRSHWSEHVEFPVVLRDVQVTNVPGEDPDIHQLLERLRVAEEKEVAEVAAENAATEAKQSPEQD